jgi:two-component system NarL family sensor kinase
VAELLGLSTGWVFLIDEETGEPYLAASQNLPPALADAPDALQGSCYCLDTYRAGDLGGAANVNVVTCSRLKWLMEGTAGLRYHASIPMYASGKKLGVLNVASADWRELSAADLRLLNTVGDLLGIAVERARLFSRTALIGALEERNRLAREIHDTLAQDLTAIGLRLEAADAVLEAGADTEKVHAVIRQALALTRTSLEEARRSVMDLRAAPLEGRTLAEALPALAEEWGRGGGHAITCETKGTDRRIPSRIEIGLYRIAQEALNNVARHAGARHVRICLETSDESTVLLIEDDGSGFDPYRVIRGHHGLVGMNERAKLLGGWLRIASSPGEGTRVEVTVPLRE